MRQASKRVPHSAEKTVRDIRRATRRHHSAEKKIRIVLEGLRAGWTWWGLIAVRPACAGIATATAERDTPYYQGCRAGRRPVNGDGKYSAGSPCRKHVARRFSEGL